LTVIEHMLGYISSISLCLVGNQVSKLQLIRC